MDICWREFCRSLIISIFEFVGPFCIIIRWIERLPCTISEKTNKHLGIEEANKFEYDDFMVTFTADFSSDV